VISRRALVTRGLVAAAAAGALWSVRDRLPWPPLRPVFANGRDTPWLPLPPGGGLIEIAVAVNGAPVRAIVDTGAQVSAIDRVLAERLALPRIVAAPILAYGVSGHPRLVHTVRLDLAVPGLAIGGLRAAVLDLADISQVSGRDFQLLIGRDVLNRLVVDADFPRDRARFIAPAAFRPPPYPILAPLTSRGGAPLVTVRIEDGPPLELLVDTGASGMVALSRPAAQAAGLIGTGRPAIASHSVGLSGLSQGQTVRARSMRMAGLRLVDVDIQVFDPTASGPTPVGLLGAGVLSNFRATLDLGGQRLFLETGALSIVPPPREQRP